MVLLNGPWVMKRGSLSPPYRGTLRRADKSPVDLSDPAIDHIQFVMRERRTLTPVVEADVTIIQEGDAVTGTNIGVFEYDWQPGDTDITGGYYSEVVVYDATDNVLVRIPNDSYQEIQILGNLSQVPSTAIPAGPLLNAVAPNTASVTATSLVLTLTGSGFGNDASAVTVILYDGTGAGTGVMVASATDGEVTTEDFSAASLDLAGTWTGSVAVLVAGVQSNTVPFAWAP